MFSIKTILHPTDFSANSQGAFELACSLARDHGAVLVVLHVNPPPSTHADIIARRQPNGHHEVLWEQLRRIDSDDPTIIVDHRLEEGDPAREILRVTRELPCDLIVMGTHGRTGLSRLLMGSIAEQIVRKAPCPVVTAKASRTRTGAEQTLAETAYV